MNYCYELYYSRNIKSMHELTLCIPPGYFYEQFKLNKLPSVRTDTILDHTLYFKKPACIAGIKVTRKRLRDSTPASLSQSKQHSEMSQADKGSAGRKNIWCNRVIWTGECGLEDLDPEHRSVSSQRAACFSRWVKMIRAVGDLLSPKYD